MKSCDDLNVDLLRYLDNDLSEQEFKYLRAHLDTCVYCQGQLERERALSRFLRESRPLYSAPAELRIQVSAAIERNSTRYRSRWDWWRRASPLVLNWKMLVPAALAIALCLMAVPNIVQNVRAASYVEAALTNHDRYLHGELGPGIRTKSPEAVTAWFADKVRFNSGCQVRKRRSRRTPLTNWQAPAWCNIEESQQPWSSTRLRAERSASWLKPAKRLSWLGET